MHKKADFDWKSDLPPTVAAAMLGILGGGYLGKMIGGRKGMYIGGGLGGIAGGGAGLAATHALRQPAAVAAPAPTPEIQEQEPALDEARQSMEDAQIRYQQATDNIVGAEEGIGDTAAALASLLGKKSIPYQLAYIASDVPRNMIDPEASGYQDSSEAGLNAASTPMQAFTNELKARLHLNMNKTNEAVDTFKREHKLDPNADAAKRGFWGSGIGRAASDIGLVTAPVSQAIDVIGGATTEPLGRMLSPIARIGTGGGTPELKQLPNGKVVKIK